VIQQHLALEKYPARPLSGLAIWYAAQVFAEFSADTRKNFVAIVHCNAANQVNLRMFLFGRFHMWPQYDSRSTSEVPGEPGTSSWSFGFFWNVKPHWLAARMLAG